LSFTNDVWLPKQSPFDASSNKPTGFSYSKLNGLREKMNLIPVEKSQSLNNNEGSICGIRPMKLMILDPHILFRTGLVSLLKDQTDIQISVDENPASNLIQQISILQPNIIIMSGALYEAGGRETMIEILSEYPDVAVLILAFQESTELMLDAIQNGAKGYLPMDFTKSVLVKSLHAMARGELAISRSMAARIAEAFSRMSRALSEDTVELESLTLTMNNEILLRLFISDNMLHIDVRSMLKKLNM
jgi:DNA-binding NarL/FixJ family response regulator